MDKDNPELRRKVRETMELFGHDAEHVFRLNAEQVPQDPGLEADELDATIIATSWAAMMATRNLLKMIKGAMMAAAEDENAERWKALNAFREQLLPLADEMSHTMTALKLLAGMTDE